MSSGRRTSSETLAEEEEENPLNRQGEIFAGHRSTKNFHFWSAVRAWSPGWENRSFLSPELIAERRFWERMAMEKGVRCGSVNEDGEERLGFVCVKSTRGLGRKRIVFSSNAEASPGDSAMRAPLKRQCSGRLSVCSGGSALEALPQDILVSFIHFFPVASFYLASWSRLWFLLECCY